MIDFALHPLVYSTSPDKHNLSQMLEHIWIKNHNPGDGNIFILSGFANYNGGVRFYRHLLEHTENGGSAVAYLGGSSSQNLSSVQVVEALLSCGVDVKIINRRKIFHSKCYGKSTRAGESLIVSSGNFTGPGMSQNVESSLLLEESILNTTRFEWENLISGINSQNWQILSPSLSDKESPAWRLLYQENGSVQTVEDDNISTLLITLGHADTVRIQAETGSTESRGTQYFWLSKELFDFFPPLTIKNKRGYKGTFSCMIDINFIDLGKTHEQRVTFEMHNNVDVRLGTGPLRNTKLAAQGDLAALKRTGFKTYDLHIISQHHSTYKPLAEYAMNYIGHQGKRYGFIENADFEQIADTSPPRTPAKFLI